jgi:hypothetical protein
MTSLTALQVAALQQTYPGWRIMVHDGKWWAHKIAQPTAELRAAGVHAMLCRLDAPALAAALAQQHGIVHRTRH